MKRKFTILLFSLLLAVGWTNSASAQALPQGIADRLRQADVVTSLGVNESVKSMPNAFLKDAISMQNGISNVMNAPKDVKSLTRDFTRASFKAMSKADAPSVRNNAPRRVADTGPNSAVHDKAYYQRFTFDWTDGDNNQVHEDVDPTEVATNPYHIYELLRWVYGNPNFPGPTYSAYTPAYVQEDPVEYGAIAGGWDITAAGSNTNAITINFPNSNVVFDSIEVKVNGEILTHWYCKEASSNTSTSPYSWSFNTDWTASGNVCIFSYNSNYYYYGYFNGGGTVTIPKSLLNNNNDVEVVVHAVNMSTSTAASITVNGVSQSLSTDEDAWFEYYTWDVSFPEEGEYVQGTVVPPYEDGYTALIVSLYNDTTKIYEEPSDYQGSWQFTAKADLIEYIRDNIQSVKLLTDGLRIGSRDDHTIGTVFSCDGTYNRFFLLGKGQARKKAPQLQTNINNGTWPEYTGEEGPFKTMFEQFSPTTGDEGADITNFYSKLMEGNTYNVIHDCASVIQNKHQFSMSGKKGEQAIALVGLNFFIPDYRLLWWSLTRTVNGTSATVDGRDMNPYVQTNTSTGAHYTSNLYSSTTSIPPFAAWFGQYNQSYAPKMGIYKISLEASATQVAQLHAPGNQNYEVTLTWVSSLNQMSGHDVPQTYTVYYWDPETGEQKYVVAEGVTNGQTGLTTISYLVEQFEHSYTIDYIVEGSPDDNEHPQFVAISNIDGVVIPGWSDFVGLELDHHESDFVVADMANWYRNFLAVVNSDPYAGLTVSKVTGADGGTPMNSFNLYRWAIKDGVKQPEEKVATMELSNATPTSVHYKVTYDDDGSNADLEDQEILAAKYQRETMGIKDEGDIRVKGNGDIVIWPNSYAINFRSITVYNGSTVVTSWNYNQNDLPSTWIVSPGSKWEEYTTTTTPSVKVGYMEGGGYIAIPNMTNNYSNLRVVIEAFGEAGNVNRISVNDDSQIISATTTGTTYEWNSLSANALHAPKRAGTYTLLNDDIDGSKYTTGQNISVSAPWTANSVRNQSGGVLYILSGGSLVFTVPSGYSNANFKFVFKTSTSYYSGYFTFAPSNGASQSVTTSAANTEYEYEATGLSAGNTVTITGKYGSQNYSPDFMYMYVYVEENGSSGTVVKDLTVCDGSYLADPLPVFGYFHDVAQHNQMVYPASLLGSDMVGKKIKSMTFYPTTGWVDADEDGVYDSGEETYSGLNFSGGTVTFKLANLSSGTAAFSEENSTLITGTMTQVASVTPTANSSATTWVITFDGDGFEYTGGDLLIDVTTTAGNYARTAFTVDAVDTYRGVYTFTYNGESANYGCEFLPKVTFSYETEGGEAPAVEGGLLRMHLLLCDQLKEDIPTSNKHPEAYGYILRYEPDGGTAKESGSVKVDIEKTDAQPNGYYTKTQIDEDTDAGLTMNILDAQVKMNLNKDNPNVLYFDMMGAPMNTIPNEYLTQLQYIRNAQKYEEMLETSPHVGDQYNPDEVHYYFNEATPEIGKYVNDQGQTDWKAYAPSVSTWGIERRYFEDDGLHNTYGAPIWRTSVGDVEIQGSPAMQRQVKSASDNSPNPWTSWTVENTVYNLFFLDVKAEGKLPNPAVTNIPYEPYMFRVFVASPTGKLRKYNKVLGEGGGYYLTDGGAIAANEKYCVGSFYSGDGWNPSDLFFSKGFSNATTLRDGGSQNLDPNAWDGIMKFAAEDGITKDDIKVYVRFYYMVEGWNRAAEARPGNGAEGSGDPDNPGTFIYELVGNGEIVSQTFYNAQGMQSDQPFDGLNIVVTRYSDGTTSTTKVIR